MHIRRVIVLVVAVLFALTTPLSAQADNYQGSGRDAQISVEPVIDGDVLAWLNPLVEGADGLSETTFFSDYYSYMNPLVAYRDDNGDVVIVMGVHSINGGVLPDGTYTMEGTVVINPESGKYDLILGSVPSVSEEPATVPEPTQAPEPIEPKERTDSQPVDRPAQQPGTQPVEAGGAVENEADQGESEADATDTDTVDEVVNEDEPQLTKTPVTPLSELISASDDGESTLQAEDEAQASSIEEDDLSRTGVSVWIYAATAALLVLAGVAAVWLRRRGQQPRGRHALR